MKKSNVKSVLQEVEYRKIKIKLNEIMSTREISTYELSNKANIRFQTIQSLKENTASRIDFEVLAKLCYVLEIKVEDLIEYE